MVIINWKTMKIFSTPGGRLTGEALWNPISLKNDPYRGEKMNQTQDDVLPDEVVPVTGGWNLYILPELLLQP